MTPGRESTGRHTLNGKLRGANIYSRIFLRPSRGALLVLDPCHFVTLVRLIPRICQPNSRNRGKDAHAYFAPVAWVASLA